MKFFKHFSHSFFMLAMAAFIVAGCKDDEAPIDESLPLITSLDPESGPVGTEVSILGKNFGENEDDIIVQFNGGRQAEIRALHDQQITVIVPENAVTGKISIVTQGKTISGPIFTVTVPETGITALRPSQVAEGMKVKLIGNNFGTSKTDHVVKFNGTEATISSVKEREIEVVVPANISNGRVVLTMGGKTYEGPEFTILEEDVDLSEGFSMDAGISTIGETFVYNDQAVNGITALRLTPAKADRVGIGYYGTRIPVENGFETTFEFRISRPGRPEGQSGEIGAEGLAFVIHNDPAGLEARGHRGGSLGYAGITNGVAIEFDAYKNMPGEHDMKDPNGNHISVQTNTNPKDKFGKIGAEIYHSLGHTGGEGMPAIPDFIGNESSKHKAKIVYDPGMLKVYLNDMSTPVLEVEMTLTDYMQLVNGKAFVGFTATTGVDWGWASHDILNWTLQPKTGSSEGGE